MRSRGGSVVVVVVGIVVVDVVGVLVVELVDVVVVGVGGTVEVVVTGAGCVGAGAGGFVAIGVAWATAVIGRAPPPGAVTPGSVAQAPATSATTRNHRAWRNIIQG